MAEKPNIIFVMPDQLRADFLGCYDASFIDTPNIDALADHGVIYGNAYSAHPVCVPARVSLMTGMNAIKTGVLDNGAFLRPDYRDCGRPRQWRFPEARLSRLRPGDLARDPERERLLHRGHRQDALLPLGDQPGVPAPRHRRGQGVDTYPGRL